MPPPFVPEPIVPLPLPLPIFRHKKFGSRCMVYWDWKLYDYLCPWQFQYFVSEFPPENSSNFQPDWPSMYYIPWPRASILHQPGSLPAQLHLFMSCQNMVQHLYFSYIRLLIYIVTTPIQLQPQTAKPNLTPVGFDTNIGLHTQISQAAAWDSSSKPIIWWFCLVDLVVSLTIWIWLCVQTTGN